MPRQPSQVDVLSLVSRQDPSPATPRPAPHNRRATSPNFRARSAAKSNCPCSGSPLGPRVPAAFSMLLMRSPDSLSVWHDSDLRPHPRRPVPPCPTRMPPSGSVDRMNRRIPSRPCSVRTPRTHRRTRLAAENATTDTHTSGMHRRHDGRQRFRQTPPVQMHDSPNCRFHASSPFWYLIRSSADSNRSHFASRAIGSRLSYPDTGPVANQPAEDRHRSMYQRHRLRFDAP